MKLSGIGIKHPLLEFGLLSAPNGGYRRVEIQNLACHGLESVAITLVSIAYSRLVSKLDCEG